MTNVPVLMYHSVNPAPPPGTAPLAVHPDAFAEQMALLAERGYTPVTFGALGRGEYTGRPVVITFDDGYADLHEHALPVLAGHGFAATLFVTTGWLSDAGDDAAGRPLDATLSWSRLAECAAAGVEVAGHSHSHPQLDQLPAPRLADELTRNRALLEDRLGGPVTTMAYPYGYSSARVRRAVRAAGYTTAAAVANRTAALIPSPRTEVEGAIHRAVRYTEIVNDVADPTPGSDPSIAPRRTIASGPRPAAPTGSTWAGDVLAVPRVTVRWGMPIGTFGRVLDGADRVYARDRALTKGYAVVRRTRYAAGRVLRAAGRGDG